MHAFYIIYILLCTLLRPLAPFLKPALFYFFTIIYYRWVFFYLFKNSSHDLTSVRTFRGTSWTTPSTACQIICLTRVHIVHSDKLVCNDIHYIIYIYHRNIENFILLLNKNQINMKEKYQISITIKILPLQMTKVRNTT
jgi:hypothetical protein